MQYVHGVYSVDATLVQLVRQGFVSPHALQPVVLKTSTDLTHKTRLTFVW
jgi:hypothetical protein